MTYRAHVPDSWRRSQKQARAADARIVAATRARRQNRLRLWGRFFKYAAIALGSVVVLVIVSFIALIMTATRMTRR